MNEFLQNIPVAALLFGVLAFMVRLENRLTKLETKLETILEEKESSND